MTKSYLSRPYLTLLYGFLVFFLSANFGAYAQEGRYQLTSDREIPLLAAGAAGVTTSLLLREQREPLSLEDLNRLDMNDIPALDRHTVDNYSERAATISDALVGASFAAPLALLAFEEARSDVGTLGVMLLETLLLNEALTGMTKALLTRPRPYTYNTDLPTELRIVDDHTFSFFSGHTSHSAAAAFFTARVISTYTDQPAVRTVAWVGAAVLPAATGLMRYEAGKHFPTDVVVGYVVGASIGLLVPYLHEVRENSKSERAIQIVPHGMGVAVVF